MALTVGVELETLSCSECGITYAIAANYMRQRRQERDANGNKYSWKCPNGHGQVSTELEVDRLKRELEAEQRKRQAAESVSASERATREEAERREARLRKRIANGVCPECKRTFQNVARHMNTCHGVTSGGGSLPKDIPATCACGKARGHRGRCPKARS